MSPTIKLNIQAAIRAPQKIQAMSTLVTVTSSSENCPHMGRSRSASE